MQGKITNKVLYLIAVACLIVYAGLYVAFSKGKWSWGGLGLRLPFYALGIFLIFLSVRIEMSTGRRTRLRHPLLRILLSGFLTGLGICIWSISSESALDLSASHLLINLMQWLVFGWLMALSSTLMNIGTCTKNQSVTSDN